MTRIAAVILAASTVGCASYRTTEQPSPSQPKLASSVASAHSPATAKPSQEEVRALEKTLRDLLVKHVPDPIVESAQGWGHQEESRVRTKLLRDGPRLRSEPLMEMRNHGTWRRVAVKAVNPAHTLAVVIKDAQYPEPGRATFTAMIGVDCAIKFEQQLWRHGTRLYGGQTRAKCRAALVLKCEVTSRTERKPGNLVPDMIVRVRATDAQLFYDGLVVEHTAGVGGDAAKILGDAVIHMVKQAKPDLERDLLAKANAAIIKAADTKDMRLSFDAVLKH